MNVTKNWEVDQEVKISNKSYIARMKLQALGDWLLTNLDGDQLYLYSKYNGCRQITPYEAEGYIEIDRDTIKCRVHNEKVKTEQAAASKQSINKLFAA